MNVAEHTENVSIGAMLDMPFPAEPVFLSVLSLFWAGLWGIQFRERDRRCSYWQVRWRALYARIPRTACIKICNCCRLLQS